MNKYFNIIPSQNNSCCILLYGYIGDEDKNNSADITRELMEAAALYKDIDIRINSMGGEVYAGIAIFNAIRNSTANITIYIDGIAASMASVIASCGKPLKASRYSRMMIHSVQGGVWGNTNQMSECIQEMEQLEDILCDIYAAKCGKDKQAIKAEFFDGKDHWLTADQALEMGLVDEIYDTDPIPEDSSIEQIYTIYHNRAIFKPNNTTMLNKIKQRPSFANCADEEQVIQQITDLETHAERVITLEQEIETLKAENATYRQQEQERDAAEIEAAVSAVPEPQREHFRAILQKDKSNGLALINSMYPNKRVMSVLNTKPQSTTNAWDERKKEIKQQLKNSK